jgi:uncharacterized protein YjiS (DUF1127 family)
MSSRYASDKTEQWTNPFVPILRALRTYHDRRRQRFELSMMSEHDLADLAMSRGTMLWEIDKWFWRD